MASDEIDVELKQLGELARGASSDFKNLAFVVQSFARANPLKQTFLVTLKQSRELLKAAGGDVDKVKAALKGAGVSGRDTSLILRQLGGDIDKMRRSAMGFDSIWQRIFSPRTLAYAAHAMQTVTGGFSVMKTMMGGPLGLAKDVVGRGIDLGKSLLDSVVEAAEFRQNALTGMSYMLGGDMEKARGLFADAQKLASETPLDTDKVISGIKTFLTQGFSADQSKFLYRVVADQASKFLDEPGVERNVIEAFSRLQGKGVATVDDFDSLRVAKFRAKDIAMQLKAQQGIPELMARHARGELGGEGQKQMKAVIAGKASETEALKAIRGLAGTGYIEVGSMLNAAIGSMYEGQKLEEGPGSLAKKFGKESLTGALSNAKNAFGDMLKSIDLVNTKGFKALIGGVDEFGKPFDGFLAKLTEGVMGSTKLRDTIVGLTDSIFGGFAKIRPSDIERVINVIGALGQKVIGFFKEAWGWLDKLMHAEPGEFLSNVKGVLIDVGTYLGQGILAGMKGAAVAGLKEMAFSKPGESGGVDYLSKYGFSKDMLAELAAKRGSSLDSFLPQFAAARSEYVLQGKDMGVGAWLRGGTMGKAEDIASMIPASGADVPKFGDGGYVNTPTLAVVGDKGGEYMVPERKMGGTNITVPVQLFYAGSADPDDLAAALEPVAMRVFRMCWQRTAMEVGGNG